MKKIVLVTLLLISFAAVKISAEETALTSQAENNYRLDIEADDAYKLKEVLQQEAQAYSSTVSEEATEAVEAKEKQEPRIVREDTKDGYIEKLMAPDGNIIAEKTYIGDEVVKNVLNYYYPNGKLSRRIIAADNDSGFYAEEYYMNGKVAAQATFLNENNKIGTEKKYDANGILRQEIPWVLPKDYENLPMAERKTIPYGMVKSYYPDGKQAAIIPIGVKDTAIFYGLDGRTIKEVSNAELLSFAPDLREQDCQEKAVQLSLKELVELYEDEGDISYNKCGMPYRETFVYEVNDMQGTSGTVKISYDEIGMIRRMTPYMQGQKNGQELKFDASGNLTAEINYKDGKKEGEAKGYFPTKEVAFNKKYKNGKVEGTLTCYFPDGNVAAELHYKDGLKEGTSKIHSPVSREIVFVNDKMQNVPEKKEGREVVSVLSALETPDTGCLKLGDKVDSLALDVESNANKIKEAFSINLPKECADLSAFKSEEGQYVCYNAENKVQAYYSAAYRRGEFAYVIFNNADGQIAYEIPYLKHKRQGWVKHFDANNKLDAEIYYNEGKLDDTSRTYHPNGAVKDMLLVTENGSRQVLSHYGETGALLFSLNLKDGIPEQSYLAEPENNKDIYLTYYKGKLDKIRETNATSPENFLEYNLVLNEYVVFRADELIKGGKICAQQKSLETVVEPIALNSSAVEKNVVANKAEATAPVAEVKKEVPAVEVKTEAKEVKTEAKIESLKPTTAEEKDLANKPVTLPTFIPIAKISEDGKITTLTKEEREELSKEQQPKPQSVRPENALIPTEEEKRQAELAAENIGPVSTPAIKELSDVVAKTHMNEAKPQNIALDKVNTEKFYYPNGSLRKTVKTRGSRTEEIKEYSKTGLLLTDTTYNQDSILTEKYFGSGQIRRKINKSYDDNAAMAFVSREDFYDSGKPRYIIERKPDVLLFSEKVYRPDGSIREETEQTSVLGLSSTEYNDNGVAVKSTEQFGSNMLTKMYDKNGKLQKLELNGKNMPLEYASDSAKLLQDNAKVYNKGVLIAEMKAAKDKNTLVEYHPGKVVKSEVVFYDNGEISVKSYAKNGTLEKYAYLAPDGKMYIQKPEVRVIPAYRERRWVEYNNPLWVENQDKYSVKSITRLYLDTATHMMAEIGMDVPENVRQLYALY